MVKKSSTTMTLHAKATRTESEAADRAHKTELINSTLDAATYVGHGHAVGSGATGKMVPNDSAYQGKPHTYIPQGVLAQNRQSTDSDGAGSANANDPSTTNYGKVDED